jgi:hypothetical protein
MGSTPSGRWAFSEQVITRFVARVSHSVASSGTAFYVNLIISKSEPPDRVKHFSQWETSPLPRL